MSCRASPRSHAERHSVVFHHLQCVYQFSTRAPPACTCVSPRTAACTSCCMAACRRPHGCMHPTQQAADAASRLAEGEDPDAAQLPPGTVEFNVPPPQLTSALAEDSLAVDAAPDIDVPDALLPPERLDELLAQRQPAYVPLAGADAVRGFPIQPPESASVTARQKHAWKGSITDAQSSDDRQIWACRRSAFERRRLVKLMPPFSQVDNTPDSATGVVQLQLSNGIKVNYRRTDNEPQAAMIRMVAAGGRACEGQCQPLPPSPCASPLLGSALGLLSPYLVLRGWARRGSGAACLLSQDSVHAGN